MESIQQKIFKIKSQEEFNRLCMEVFHYQAENCPVYKQYLSLIEKHPANITAPEQIPALPIRFFKTKQIITLPIGSNENSTLKQINDSPHPQTQIPSAELAKGQGLSTQQQIIFTSSATTGMTPSKHYVLDTNLYETSFTKGFRLFYGNPEEYTILALLPSYLERKGSSLVYMAEHLIKQSKDPVSGFYLYNYEDLYKILVQLKKKINRPEEKKAILLGVSFALLDFVKEYKIDFPQLTIIETGGMKGRGKELGREELHRILSAGFGVKEIHSEYGMAELLSQAYSTGDGIFRTPPWMRIYIRDPYNPFTSPATPGVRGGINIIDLANINSCSFIETEDMGRVFEDGSFAVDGRIKDSELRGCNLLLEKDGI